MPTVTEIQKFPILKMTSMLIQNFFSKQLKLKRIMLGVSSVFNPQNLKKPFKLNTQGLGIFTAILWSLVLLANPTD